MFVLRILVFIVGILFTQGDEFQEYDVDISGDKASNFQNRAKTRRQTSDGLSVNFYNSYNNETLELYWEGVNNDDSLIGDINPLSTMAVNTFDGHSFYALLKSDKVPQDRAFPPIMTIHGAGEDYTFGPFPTSDLRTRPHPAVKYINQRTTSMSARFKSLAPHIDIYYDDGNAGQYQGTLKQGAETTTNTYEGHVFFFTEHGKKEREISRHKMMPGQSLYLVEDPANPAPPALNEQIQRELNYIAEYTNRTGVEWRHYYGPEGPRPPPRLFMWPTPAIGHVHKIVSPEGKWHCDGPANVCQSSEPVNLELEVISIFPKVFIIPNFLSDFEAEQIVDLAAPQLKGSLVGNQETGGGRNSDTRTSRNAWVKRGSNFVTETLFQRAANLLQIDEKLLNSDTNAEDMQVVYYRVGQKYDNHHDWGVNNKPNSRYITLLLYLNDQENPNAGGETSFPKAADGRGIKVHPGKGSAVLFYNLLEDGNADELTLHSATPVKSGEKWLANL